MFKTLSPERPEEISEHLSSADGFPWRGVSAWVAEDPMDPYTNTPFSHPAFFSLDTNLRGDVRRIGRHSVHSVQSIVDTENHLRLHAVTIDGYEGLESGYEATLLFRAEEQKNSLEIAAKGIFSYLNSSEIRNKYLEKELAAITTSYAQRDKRVREYILGLYEQSLRHNDGPTRP